MKTKLLYIAALALLVSFTACENETPFDTQTPDDDPLILKPYNESGTGSFTYDLANPDTPLHDSVTVTPSKYTTVNWYIDGQLMFTGLKINMTFQTGKYKLTIEAVTDKGKRTERFGTVTVHPYATDPYAPAPSSGRYLMPGKAATVEGSNLDKVTEVIIAPDVRGREAVCTLTPSAATAAKLTFSLPDIAEGNYYLRFRDAEGNVYGSDALVVSNDAPEPPVSGETTLWEGHTALLWNADRIKVTKEEMASVPVGSKIYVYFEKLPDGDENFYDNGEYKQYYALRITTPKWGDNPEDNLVKQTDMSAEVSPFVFEYDDHCKALVDERDAMSLVGWGLYINKITYQ